MATAVANVQRSGMASSPVNLSLLSNSTLSNTETAETEDGMADTELDDIDRLLLHADNDSVLSRLKSEEINQLVNEALLVQSKNSQDVPVVDDGKHSSNRMILAKNGLYKRSIRAHKKYIEILKGKELDLASMELNEQTQHLQELAENLRINEEALEIMHQEKMEAQQQLEQTLQKNRHLASSRDESERKVIQMRDILKQMQMHIVREICTLRDSLSQVKEYSKQELKQQQQFIYEIVQEEIMERFKESTQSPFTAVRNSEIRDSDKPLDDQLQDLMLNYEQRMQELSEFLDDDSLPEKDHVQSLPRTDMTTVVEKCSTIIHSATNGNDDLDDIKKNMQSMMEKYDELKTELVQSEQKQRIQRTTILSSLRDSDAVRLAIKELQTQISDLKKERSKSNQLCVSAGNSTLNDPSLSSKSVLLSQHEANRRRQNSDLRKLRVQLSLSETQLKQAELHNQHLEDTVTQLGHEMQLHEEAKTQLQKEVQRLQLSNGKLQQATARQIQDLSGRLEKLQQENIALQDHVNRMTLVLNAKTETERRMAEEVDSLSERLRLAGNNIRQNRSNETEHQSDPEKEMLRQKIVSLSQEVVTLKCILDERTHDRMVFQSDRKEIKEHAKNLEKKVSRLKREILKLRNREGRHVRMKSECERRIVQLEEEKQDLQLRLRELLHFPVAKRTQPLVSSSSSKTETKTKEPVQTMNKCVVENEQIEVKKPKPPVQEQQQYDIVEVHPEPISFHTGHKRHLQSRKLEEIERQIAQLEKDNAMLRARVNINFGDNTSHQQNESDGFTTDRRSSIHTNELLSEMDSFNATVSETMALSPSRMSLSSTARATDGASSNSNIHPNVRPVLQPILPPHANTRRVSTPVLPMRNRNRIKKHSVNNSRRKSVSGRMQGSKRNSVTFEMNNNQVIVVDDKEDHVNHTMDKENKNLLPS